MTHGGGVDRLRVVVDHPGQAEVGHFAYEVAVDQDVARGQISMDVAHVGEVAHPRRDAPQHPHQLDDCELAVVFLGEDVGEINDIFTVPQVWKKWQKLGRCALSNAVLTLRKASKEPFSMYSMTIITGFPGEEKKNKGWVGVGVMNRHLEVLFGSAALHNKQLIAKKRFRVIFSATFSSAFNYKSPSVPFITAASK